MSYKGKRIEFQGVNGETIYVAKKAYEGIRKKAIITKEYLAPGKLVIEYTAKKSASNGVLELYDIGPKQN